MAFDTTPEAARAQQEVFRRMATIERLSLALQMSESIRNVALAGLRARQPGWNAQQLSNALMRVMYGFDHKP